MKKTTAALLLVGMGFLFSLKADEVIFTSGDRLTGTVKTVAGGKMTFESKVAGTLTLKMADIKTFSTEKPVEVVLKSGETIKMPAVVSDKNGYTRMGGDDNVSLSEIVKLNPPPVKWTGKVTAGLSLVRGNTETTGENLAFEAARRSENIRWTGAGAYYYEKQKNIDTKDETTTANNFFLKGQGDYFLTEKNYVYGSLKFEKDIIANLDKRWSPGVGYGRQWLERPDLNFSSEIGGSWLYEKYSDPEEERKYMAGRLAYHIDKTLWSKVKLYHNFEWIPSSENINYYLINADAGMQIPLMKQLAFDAKMQVAYNSEPADDRYQTDSRYLVGISWLF